MKLQKLRQSPSTTVSELGLVFENHAIEDISVDSVQSSGSLPTSRDIEIESKRAHPHSGNLYVHII